MSSDLHLNKSIDLHGNELKNARPHRLATDPTGLDADDEGITWFNTTENVTKYWSGTAVIELSEYATEAAIDEAIEAHEEEPNPHPIYLREGDLGGSNIGSIRYATLVKFGV